MSTIDLSRSPTDDSGIARNQYEATLQGMSKEALLRIAQQEHQLNIVPDAPKRIIIQHILDHKYGGSK